MESELQQSPSKVPDSTAKPIMKVSTEHKFYRYEEKYMIPTYPTLVVKSIDNIDGKTSTFNISFTLVLRFIIQGGEDFLKQRLNSDSITIQLNSRVFNLTEDDPQKKTTKRMITNDGIDRVILSYRDEATFHFDASLHKTPFDYFVLPFKLEVVDLILSSQKIDNKIIRVRFSIHEPLRSVVFKERCQLPDFFIIYSKTTSKITKEEISVEKKKELSRSETQAVKKEVKIEYEDEIIKENSSLFSCKNRKKGKVDNKKDENSNKPRVLHQYSEAILFEFHAQRKPINLIITVMAPLFVLQLFALSILAQDPADLGSRLSNLSTITLALFAFLPTLRANIPQVNYFTLPEKIVYVQIFQSLIILLQSILLHFFDIETYNILSYIAIYLTLHTFGLVNYYYILYRKKISRWEMRFPKRITADGSHIDVTEWKNNISHLIIEDIKKYQLYWSHSPPEKTIADISTIKL